LRSSTPARSRFVIAIDEVAVLGVIAAASDIPQFGLVVAMDGFAAIDTDCACRVGLRCD